MFNSDTLANRPAAGIVGRIFIAIDSPFGIYRDTGSAWDAIAGASTFSGSLATGQVAFGSATNTISGSNNLVFDNANSRFGIGTNNPLASLQINGAGNNSSTTSLSVNNLLNTNLFSVRNDGLVSVSNTFFVGTGTNGFTITNSSITNGLVNISSDRVQLRVNAGPVYFYNQGDSGSASTIIMAGKDGASTAFAPVIIGSGTNASLTRETMRIINQTQNVHIGTTFVADNGSRLQVYGDSFLRGSGNTTATTAFTLQNSDATNILRINNAGQAIFGTNPQSIGVRLETDGIFRAWSQLEVGQFGTLAITTTQLTKGASGSDFYEFRNSSSITAPNGTYYFLQLTNSFTPTSGIAVVNGLNINFTINQTGGANGITRGIRIAPTLTSAADWRSIEWSNNTGWGLYGAGTALNYLGGTLGIKTTSPYAPSTFSLDVNGGLLVKNTAGTTAQITLINADPSLGGNNGFLVASVGGTSGGSYVDLQGYYGTSIVGSTALRLNPAGGAVIVNSTTNTGEQFQLTGTLRINGQSSGTSGGNSGQHLIINLDGTTYKIKLELP
jgi:hypothetical protein